MAYNPPSHTHPHGMPAVLHNREHRRMLKDIRSQSEMAITQIQAAVEVASAGVQARDAVAAAAAQADTVLSGMLSALPIYDATDPDFRGQLQRATRSGVIADVLRFNP